MHRTTLRLAILLAFATGAATAQNFVIPTTTLAAQTANNTSAANSFAAQTNGNTAAGSVSKVDIHSLLYTGATTKIYAHLMVWFGGSNHMNVGYNSTDPNQVHSQITDMISLGIDGVIIGNTTVTRPASIPPAMAKETGGLSGRPLFTMSTSALARMYKLTQKKIPLIGCGGVGGGADAYAKICAGASLVQLYTALVFEGPGLVADINRDLAKLLQRDGFKSVNQAVGVAT